jgi:F-type H+-transporting ATPase subunit a
VSEISQHYLPYIIIFNFALVAVVLVVLGVVARSRKLEEVPDPIQNVAEFALEWFVRRARAIHPDGVTVIAPFLASLFLFILFSNLLVTVSFPIIGIPPTSYYGGTLTLAIIAVVGTTLIGAKFMGTLGAITHLFWPNPLQLVTKVSDILSLSLRLFGNIGGEFLVVLLVVEAAPYGIPLVVHSLGLIPTFIQPLVFTLLTSNFLAETFSTRGKKAEVDTQTPPPFSAATEGKGAHGS